MSRAIKTLGLCLLLCVCLAVSALAAEPGTLSGWENWDTTDYGGHVVMTCPDKDCAETDILSDVSRLITENQGVIGADYRQFQMKYIYTRPANTFSGVVNFMAQKVIPAVGGLWPCPETFADVSVTVGKTNTEYLLCLTVDMNGGSKEATALYGKIKEIGDEAISASDVTADRLAYFNTWLTSNSEYQNTGAPHENEAYGAVIEGRAVCGGYTEAVMLFCRYLGVTSTTVRSPGHIWNRVLVDGVWKHWDTTWSAGAKRGEYFLVDYINDPTALYRRSLSLLDLQRNCSYPAQQSKGNNETQTESIAARRCFSYTQNANEGSKLMKTKGLSKRLLTLLLVVVTIAGIAIPAQAASVGDGSKTCTVSTVERNYFLTTTAGTRLGATAYAYTTNDGLTGPAFCIDHGLNYTSKALPITGKYASSPKAAGAFANGYPQHTVDIFLGLYLEKNPILEGFTSDEFAYATQLAVWATLGQLAVEGTAFTAGRETLAQPVGDTQQMRVFRAVQIILMAANGWDRVYQTGMYIRKEENELGGNISIPADMTLEYAADNERYGLKREVIEGVSYYTREYIFASATSTYYSDYNIELWADGAPAGTIFVDADNKELPHGTFRETSTWTLPVTSKGTSLNTNGYEYSGTAKLCIPVDTVPNSGEITVRCGAYVMQYEIYLAYNETSYEQSYIIADPSKGTQMANAVLNWGSEITETGRLQITKVGGGGIALSGASFTLTGTDGSQLTGTTDDNGEILWEQLKPDVTYTLTETEAPAGYAIVDPINVQIQAARTNYVTVQNTTEKQLTVRKVDAQNGYSLAGAVIRFEQIDGSFRTDKTTDHAGNISMTADELPIGSYKVYELTAPEGYEKDPTPQTVDWNGRSDITLTFQNTRKPTLILYKCDEGNHFNLPGATFAVYKNGQHITDVTTNDNGLAYVSGVTTGYYTVKETVAPAGYVLDPTEHSVYVDAYNPATTDDPRIVITNRAKPSLILQKYDTQTGGPVSGCSFEVYRDAALIGTFTTDAAGQILLTGLDPGTYLAKEVAAKPGYVVNSTPQQIEIKAGDGLLRLVFLNTVKPGIHLIKIDAQTYKPLANAVFRVELIGGSFSREYTTNADGEIDLTALETGAYKVTELSAPEGYLIDTESRTIQLNAGENGVFVFTDTAKPSLTILKYDPAADKYLPGAIFRIAKIEDGSHYIDRVTDPDGRITVTGLEPGVYSVTETEAPGGYVLDGTEYHVELFAGKQSRLVVSNEAKPDLKIIKTDGLTGKGIEGATFTVKKADSSTLTTVTTGADGSVLVEDLEPGVYVVTEQSVPDAYILDATPQSITLEPNKTGTVQFQNYPKSSLTIRKVDSITASPIERARFHVWYAGSSSAAGTLTDKGYHYTNADGEISFTGLDEGWYRVTEVEPPTGYALKEPSTQELYVRQGTQNTMTFENIPLSALIIKKLDADSGEALQGAKFQVRYLAGTSGTGGTVIGTYTTNVNGVVLITGLKAGTYIVEETKAPHGYEIDDTPQTVFISGKEQDVVTVEFSDGKHGGLIVRKIDSVTKEPLPGAEFKITTSTGEYVANYGGAVSSNGLYTTDENGQIRIVNLKPGTYVVTETKAPDGYVLDSTPQTVAVTTNDTQTLTFSNAPIGGLIIVKSDYDSGARIKGAQFEVKKANGEIVGNFTTGSTGAVTVPGLSSGWYIVTETRAASGYLLDATEHRVEVKDGQTATLSITNKKASSILIHKVDAATGKGIYGVTFIVYDAGRNPVGQYVTDQRGYAYVDKELTAGKYYINPMYMPMSAYDRFLKTRGHDADEYAWRSAEFVRFKSGMDNNLEQGVEFREVLSLKRLNDIAQRGLCRMAGLYFMERGYIELDAEGCAAILKGYIEYLENVPSFNLLILDDISDLQQNSCWHLKQGRSLCINNWQAKDPVMIYSDQAMLLREFGARFDALWAHGAGGVGSRANVMSILQDVTERLEKIIRHERHICEANEEATL